MKFLYDLGKGKPMVVRKSTAGVVLAAVTNKKIVPVWSLIYFHATNNQEDINVKLYYTSAVKYINFDLHIDTQWVSSVFTNHGFNFLTEAPVNDSITVSTSALGSNVLETVLGYYLVDG